MVEYYYNTRTGLVEIGRQSQGRELMGPYATYQEAERALEIARLKSEAWEAENEKWD